MIPRKEGGNFTGGEALFSFALIAKHKLRTEPEGIEGVRQSDQYTDFHTKHVEYVWAGLPNAALIPLFISSFKDASGAEPWRRSHTVRK